MRSLSIVLLIGLVCCFEASAETPSDSLTILITGGLRGRLNVCDCPSASRGGIARRATLMQKLFSQKQPLGMDCGQFLDIDPNGGRMRSACAILALRRMGTEVALVATRDLYYGVDFISEIADSADMKLLCANILHSETKQLIFPMWVELNRDGCHIAITGLTWHFPHRRIPGMDSWITIPPDSALIQLRNTVPFTADLTILLTDMSESELNEFIPMFPELDIVFTSSRRVYTPSPIALGSTSIIRPQPDGAFLEGISVLFDSNSVSKISFFSHPLNKLITADKDYVLWLENCQKRDFSFK